ncbi:hypothetical protein HDIA_0026 [Hartmannibacter diazotrophicus]|uniref:Uncharacterized protein n=1 Tax=Hartmannibacter diazotrophicus TaxID=1482074 RepID=A0A2C9CZH4_9HYPH|nr:hypothetical protein [Hartmannibacter diazotrophicus]SON53567.1 hypothetical protein HDIA_0026 [Hartmannibacter diazotrophicus]
MSLAEEKTDSRPYEKTLLATVWLLPLLARSMGSLTLLHITPVILAFMLAVLVRRPSATVA